MATFQGMERPLHNRAFVASVGWTLGLLFLGSVVHATESSLACPDWPTCYGTMVPEMRGGIFWEHLHRLVAGGLLLLWLLATWLAWEPGSHRPWLRKATVGGFLLLLVQAVFGGLTVLLLLPDAVSTTHLGLAFAFLALATVLAVATSPRWGVEAAEEVRGDPRGSARGRRSLRPWALGVGALIFGQSLLGGWVRHADAGLACPQIPLCLGEWVPPLDQGLIAIHFFHRLVGVVLAVAVLTLVVLALRRSRSSAVRRTALAAAGLVLVQVGLGFLSVSTFLAVAPVSLHTLVAAVLLTAVTALATWTWEPVPEGAGPMPAGVERARAGVGASAGSGRFRRAAPDR